MPTSINPMREFTAHLCDPYRQMVKVATDKERLRFPLDIADKRIAFFAVSLLAGYLFTSIGVLEAVIVTVLTFYTATAMAKYLLFTRNLNRYFQN